MVREDCEISFQITFIYLFYCFSETGRQVIICALEWEKFGKYEGRKEDMRETNRTV